MIYQNFDLEIISSQGGAELHARVLDSPQGDSPSVKVIWPFGADEENRFLSDIYGGLRQRRVMANRMSTIQDFGGKLFDAVFTGDIEHLFRSSLDAANRVNKGLRIRLRLPDDSALHSRPWEFLYDTESQEFLAVRERTPLVRYLPVAQPIPPLTVEGPLRILVALAAPTDHPRLDVAREWEILSAALKAPVDAGQVELRPVPAPCTFDNLRDSLRHFGAHIFHFIGHGIPGALVLEQESGKGLEMEAAQLRAAFPSGTLPRLVVLNSCSGAIGEDVPFSGLAQGFLRQGVPAVVAMQASITDDAALIFTRYFYRDLIETGIVDASLTEARLRMQGNGHPVEWGTPVLYMRALSGQLFQPGGKLTERKTSKDSPAKEGMHAKPETAIVDRKRPREAPPRESTATPKPEPASSERKRLKEPLKKDSPAPLPSPPPQQQPQAQAQARPEPRPEAPPQAQARPEPQPKAQPRPEPPPQVHAQPQPQLEPRPAPGSAERRKTRETHAGDSPPPIRPGPMGDENPSTARVEPKLGETFGNWHAGMKGRASPFEAEPQPQESADAPPSYMDEAPEPVEPSRQPTGPHGRNLSRYWPAAGLAGLFLLAAGAYTLFGTANEPPSPKPVPAPSPSPPLPSPVNPVAANKDIAPAQPGLPRQEDKHELPTVAATDEIVKKPGPVRGKEQPQPGGRKPIDNCKNRNINERPIECLK